jgi:hypothetical protein
MSERNQGLLEPIHGLPDFSLDDYERLLVGLAENGYELRPVGEMPDRTVGRSAYLRHDIDLHVPGVERMAEVEAVLGARSTYFVLLTQHYNPLYPENRAILRRVSGLGHEIGLHYDLTTYPDDAAAAREHLAWEAGLVSSIVDAPVRCITMHQPYEGRDDVFRSGSGYVHPHDPAYCADLLYVSDSCRAWRDESLLSCLTDQPPRRLLLLTHPELWLDGAVTGRTDYLETVLMANATRQHRDFVDNTVRAVWDRHPGPRLHDARTEGAAERVG